ncbi:MAG TPA: CsbD family protein [Ktedonobacteraceae bacterium]|jgi:uncharacterized protein YjbJ (UPF0337 family)|nr:CsbD family protein [Ktedonobacteraceae bacterium]
MTEKKKDLGTQGQEDTLKGKMKQAAGKVQEKTGQALGDKEMEAKGDMKQSGGKAQSTMGKGKQKVDKALNPDKPSKAHKV